MRFLLGRLVHAVVILFGVSVLTFLLAELTPGDYLSRLRLDPSVPPETVAAMTERLALDRSPVARYLYWLGSIARLELGFSYQTGTPVASLVGVAARNTLLLGSLATLLAWAVALPLGLWSASTRGRVGTLAVEGATSALLAVPDVVLGLGLLLLAVRTGWFPTGGMTSLDHDSLGLAGRLRDLLHHLALPVFALALTMTPSIYRHTRAALSEVLASPHLRALEATGIPRRRRLLAYALPAAANPLITLFGLSIASLLSASLLVEVILSWPGIGPLLISAVFQRDVYVVMAVVMAATALLLLGNLVSDALLYACDPRIRDGER